MGLLKYLREPWTEKDANICLAIAIPTFALLIVSVIVVFVKANRDKQSNIRPAVEAVEPAVKAPVLKTD